MRDVMKYKEKQQKNNKYDEDDHSMENNDNSSNNAISLDDEFRNELINNVEDPQNTNIPNTPVHNQN